MVLPGSSWQTLCQSPPCWRAPRTTMRSSLCDQQSLRFAGGTSVQDAPAAGVAIASTADVAGAGVAIASTADVAGAGSIVASTTEPVNWYELFARPCVGGKWP
eukprot:3374777-Prymnesium_polylepis.1